MTRRVPAKATLEDVALKAGVHRTTVSLALREHPRIPAATRMRIKAIAAKLGYRINPLVSALLGSVSRTFLERAHGAVMVVPERD